MEQPIPPYLFAFAVGELGFREVGPRTRVYAESAAGEVLDAAALEFAGTEEMIRQGRCHFKLVARLNGLFVLVLSKWFLVIVKCGSDKDSCFRRRNPLLCVLACLVHNKNPASHIEINFCLISCTVVYGFSLRLVV
ncbi:hypothetical protein Bca52824_096077 [Brassica carinata]|uniref:Uncharacterized protein n=1 Tax=Brassica carinata TaxID=52824 RepID=A0A8X7P0Z0_BRACI|nr:hypothetical protein Bca52824_096077 [Brassica carinata]